MKQEMGKNIKLVDIDSFAIPKEIVKDGEKTVGYAYDANKMDYIDMIVKDENYPIENLPADLQELVISARKQRKNQDGSIRHR